MIARPAARRMVRLTRRVRNDCRPSPWRRGASC
jgi:hypothetical protein